MIASLHLLGAAQVRFGCAQIRLLWAQCRPGELSPLAETLRAQFGFRSHGTGRLACFRTSRPVDRRDRVSFLEQKDGLRVSSIVAGEPAEMLTIMATLAAPVVVLTTLMIVVYEIRDVWDQNRIE